MATTTLLIPRVIARQLTKIAQLDRFSIFPPSGQCSHWAVYNSRKNQVACPCSPLASDAQLLIRTMSAILRQNFGPHDPSLLTPADGLVQIRTDMMATVTTPATEKRPLSAQPKNSPTKGKHQLDEKQIDSPHSSPTVEDLPARPVPAPTTSTASGKPGPRHAQSYPSWDTITQNKNTPPGTETVSPQPAEPINQAPAEGDTPTATGSIPSPTALAGKFKPLPYKPPAIAQYYQDKVEPAERNNWSTEQVREDPSYRASRASNSHSEVSRHPQEPTRNLEIRPEMLKHLKELKLDYEDIKRIIERGTPEKINNWSTYYRYDDYRVELNTLSNTVLDVVDEYSSYDEGESDEREMPYSFPSEVEHYMLMRDISYSRIIRVIESPVHVDSAPSWLTAYSDNEYRVLVAPDGRTIRSVKPIKEA